MLENMRINSDLGHWRTTRNRVCHNFEAYTNLAGSFNPSSFDRVQAAVERNMDLFRDPVEGRSYARAVVDEMIKVRFTND
jgi:hypothetical protein